MEFIKKLKISVNNPDKRTEDLYKLVPQVNAIKILSKIRHFISKPYFSLFKSHFGYPYQI